MSANSSKAPARKKSRQRPTRQWTARQKVEAVLALWTERRKPSELCRELEIRWTTLDNWQSRALEAMLHVLEPRQRKEEERPPALTTRLQQLLEKKTPKPSQNALSSRLEKRLDTIESKPPSTP
ncbi:MAG: transposase [Planctomycetota bacterium]|jgi:hypothetical protein|nr:transposase [Planctomycetota bacterium]MDP7251763.1 transposase [Planctomycetota bacterium]